MAPSLCDLGFHFPPFHFSFSWTIFFSIFPPEHLRYNEENTSNLIY
jgi:hypothetical protein